LRRQRAGHEIDLVGEMRVERLAESGDAFR